MIGRLHQACSFSAFAAVMAAGIFAAAGSSHAQCRSHCPPYPGYSHFEYGYVDEARQAYFLLKEHPELAKRHPRLLATLEGRFNPAPKAEVEEVAAPEQVETIPAAQATPVAANTPTEQPAGEASAAPTAGEATAAPTTDAAPASAADQNAAAPSNPQFPGDLPAAAPAADADEQPQANPTADVNASAVPAELQPILGLWETVSKDAAGQDQVTTIELKEDGEATLTTNSSLGPVTIKAPFAVEGGEFILKGDPRLVVGKVVSAAADKVVIERDGAQLVFTRPAS